jgi:hypothetical protein
MIYTEPNQMQLLKWACYAKLLLYNYQNWQCLKKYYVYNPSCTNGK